MFTHILTEKNNEFMLRLINRIYGGGGASTGVSYLTTSFS
jgi:hypothetical protein